MKLQIRVDDKGIISDVKFKTFGCGSAIASSSYMTERVMGLSLDEAGKIKNTEIAKELCLPPVKLHCSSKFSLLNGSYYHSFMIFKCWLRMPSDQLSEITVPNGQTWLTPSKQDSSMYHRLRPVMQQLHLLASKFI